MIDAAKKLEDGGADFIVLCCNTAHTLAEKIQDKINIPLLHIADATADKIKSMKIKNVGLLGTKFTMEADFYKKRLEEKHGLKVIVPQEPEIENVSKDINKICLGKTNPQVKKSLINIINKLIERGAEGIILGCTEIDLVIKQEDVKVPLFDTTRIHAETAAQYSLTL